MGMSFKQQLKPKLIYILNYKIINIGQINFIIVLDIKI